MKPTLIYRRGHGLIESEATKSKNAPSRSKRDVSTNDEPSSEAGPQAEASLAGTGTEMPADREGQSSRGRAKASRPKLSPSLAEKEVERLAAQLNELLAEKAERKRKHNERIKRYRAQKASHRA